MFRKFSFAIGLIALFACASLVQAEEGLFAAPVKTIRPIPSEGRSVLYLLYTLSETYQFDIRPTGVDLKTLDGYNFRGKIEDMTLSAAILKVLKDSGVTGIKCRFDNDTDTLYLSPASDAVPIKVKDDKPASEKTKPQQRAVAARTGPEQANDKPAAKPSPADIRRPTEHLAVNRRFTQPAIEASNRPAQVTETETEEVITYSAPARPRRQAITPYPVPPPAARVASYPGPAPAMRYPGNYPGSGYGYGQRYYGSYYGGYSGRYGYADPYLAAEWCRNFPGNRQCTHGKVKIDGPELSGVDMYLTPLDQDGQPLAPRVNKGPVSKHNSFFNRGYFVPVGMYRVEFLSKGKDLVLFEDTIAVESDYVNQGHPQVLKVDENRFNSEPLVTEIERGRPRSITADQWKQGGVQ